VLVDSCCHARLACVLLCRASGSNSGEPPDQLPAATRLQRAVQGGWHCCLDGLPSQEAPVGRWQLQHHCAHPVRPNSHPASGTRPAVFFGLRSRSMVGQGCSGLWCAIEPPTYATCLPLFRGHQGSINMRMQFSLIATLQVVRQGPRPLKHPKTQKFAVRTRCSITVHTQSASMRQCIVSYLAYCCACAAAPVCACQAEGHPACRTCLQWSLFMADRSPKQSLHMVSKSSYACCVLTQCKITCHVRHVSALSFEISISHGERTSYYSCVHFSACCFGLLKPVNVTTQA
jgi:hypothetical protein